MKINLRPKTYLGKWSAWLIVCFLVFFGLFFLFIGLGERGGSTFFSNLKLTIPYLIAGICGVASFFTGIIGIFKDKERSILVFLSTIIGFFVFLWILAEFLFPH